jgi:hypothetical protein
VGVWLMMEGSTRAPRHSGVVVPVAAAAAAAVAAAVGKRRAVQRIGWRRGARGLLREQKHEDEDGAGAELSRLELLMGLRRVVPATGRLLRVGWWGRRTRWQLAGTQFGVDVCLRIPLLE